MLQNGRRKRMKQGQSWRPICCKFPCTLTTADLRNWFSLPPREAEAVGEAKAETARGAREAARSRRPGLVLSCQSASAGH